MTPWSLARPARIFSISAASPKPLRTMLAPSPAKAVASARPMPGGRAGDQRGLAFQHDTNPRRSVAAVTYILHRSRKQISPAAFRHRQIARVEPASRMAHAQPRPGAPRARPRRLRGLGAPPCRDRSARARACASRRSAGRCWRRCSRATSRPPPTTSSTGWPAHGEARLGAGLGLPRARFPDRAQLRPPHRIEERLRRLRPRRRLRAGRDAVPHLRQLRRGGGSAVGALGRLVNDRDARRAPSCRGCACSKCAASAPAAGG